MDNIEINCILVPPPPPPIAYNVSEHFCDPFVSNEIIGSQHFF